MVPLVDIKHNAQGENMKNNDIHVYDDIQNLAHPCSKKHKQMAMLDRAAQFAPFAALTGHMDAIIETQRLTDDKKILDEYQKEVLNDKLQEIQLHIKERPLLNVTYFESDMQKEGGAYLHVLKNIKKIDDVHHQLLFVDQSKIDIEDIYEIEMMKEDDEFL